MLRRKDVDLILTTMLESNPGVSVLNLTVGKPLQIEAHGQLHEVRCKPPIDELSPYQAAILALGVLGDEQGALGELLSTGSAETPFEIPGVCRFRANVFRQQRRLSLLLRRLQSRIYTLDELHAPSVLKQVPQEPHGLILVTGPTSSGKSTTIASLFNEINETRSVHIVTLEDPIEIVHPHGQATFNQRELGIDFDSFPGGMRAALRQAPKVIFVAELRDRETVDLAIAAASSGHLVFSTIHADDCSQTIERLLGFFDSHEEAQVRSRLADCLRWVISQRLIPSVAGGRLCAQEIVGMNLRTRDLVRLGEGDHGTFYDLTASSQIGWQTFDKCLLDMVEKGLINENVALASASRRMTLESDLVLMKQSRGVASVHDEEAGDDRYREEVDRLLQAFWPPFLTRFPLVFDGEQGKITLHEPRKLQPLGTKEKPSNLVRFEFPAKLVETQGQARERRFTKEAVTGFVSVVAEADTSSPATIVLRALKVKEVVFNKRDRSDQFALPVDRGLPFEIELPNEKGRTFGTDKEQALERIAEIGRPIDLRRLRSLLDKSPNDREKAALNRVIQKIESR